MRQNSGLRLAVRGAELKGLGRFLWTCSAGLLFPSCVLGVPSPPDRAKVASERTAVISERTAEAWRLELAIESTSRPKPAEGCRRCVWIEGTRHFDGTGYVWIPGRWEELDAPYAVNSDAHAKASK